MKKFPKNYKWMQEKFAKVMDAHQALGKELHEAGPLDTKTVHLIQLAAAAATKSEGAVHSHVKRAQEAGASPDEIYHALVLLTSTIGFPASAAALSWARDMMEKG